MLSREWWMLAMVLVSGLIFTGIIPILEENGQEWPTASRRAEAGLVASIRTLWEKVLERGKHEESKTEVAL